MIRFRLAGVVVCLLLGQPASAPADEALRDEAVQYNQDVLPILAENCFACHGADSGTREAGLRLDQREAAVDGGAIVPGDPESSSLVFRIGLDPDDDAVMPPPSSHRELTEDQKTLLARWIDEGAPYQQHWSFIPPEKVTPPAVKQADWVRNPIDQFVLARLEAAGLQPNEEADRRTLARRASLDVIGLPPEPAWVEDFVGDEKPGAYQRYLDRLFSHAGWGEHRARYWLDYARYADTHGIHFDNFREVWSYRDWVIRAFQQNMPFDQFSIEQLAGDLLDQPTLDQLIATGFHRCNMTTNEGGVIDKEYEVLYAQDRTETTAAVWLGLTAGCAVCHDHKFDPLTMKDFYSLSAFFNNTTQPVKDGNVPDTPPVIVVPQMTDRGRWTELQRRIPELEAEMSVLQKAAIEQIREDPVSTVEIAESTRSETPLLLHAPLTPTSDNATEVLVDGSLLPVTGRGPLKWQDGYTRPKSLEASKDGLLAVGGIGNFSLNQPFTASAWVYPRRRNISGVIVGRNDPDQDQRGWDLWMEEGRVAFHLIHHWPKAGAKVVAGPSLPVRQWTHVAVVNDGLGTIDSVRLLINGQEQTRRRVDNDSLFDEPEIPSIQGNGLVTVGGRVDGSVPRGLQINDVRVYGGALSAAECRQVADGSLALYAASLPDDQRQPAQWESLATWKLLRHSDDYRRLDQLFSELYREKETLSGRGTIAHVMHERDTPAAAHILHRGQYDEPLEQVGADVPAELPALSGLPRNRLGLAKWLFRDDHPLTSRVTVNRFWQEVFGMGLVRTSADFGVMGEPPTHPELLDYLSVEFRDSGWDVQELFRLILSSATYRQSARHGERAMELDPENRLLAHGPRFRMHGEMIRDSVLSAAGLLSPKVGGPSVRPYQPPGVWEAVAIPGSNTRSYDRDEGDALFRRSMYTFWKRSAPPASMDIFGAPSREVCTIQREQTNTPLQALVTLNDPQFIEAARALATTALTENEGQDERCFHFMSRRLLSRPLRPEEIDVLSESLQRLMNYYQSHPADADALLAVGVTPVDDQLPATDLAAWTMLASEMINLDETLCK